MLSKSNFIDSSHTSYETDVKDSRTGIIQDERDKIKEARENLIKNREDQAQAFKDSVQEFREESLKKNKRNKKMIASFRENILVTQDEENAKCYARADELEEKNNEMQKKLEEYIVEGKGKWISFKYEFNHDMSGLEKAINELEN